MNHRRKRDSAQSGGSRLRLSPVKPASLPDAMRERIASKAYELWETRGRREGHALQDWLDAELLMKDEIHEARQ